MVKILSPLNSEYVSKTEAVGMPLLFGASIVIGTYNQTRVNQMVEGNPQLYGKVLAELRRDMLLKDQLPLEIKPRIPDKARYIGVAFPPMKTIQEVEEEFPAPRWHLLVNSGPWVTVKVKKDKGYMQDLLRKATWPTHVYEGNHFYEVAARFDITPRIAVGLVYLPTRAPFPASLLPNIAASDITQGVSYHWFDRTSVVLVGGYRLLSPDPFFRIPFSMVVTGGLGYMMTTAESELHGASTDELRSVRLSEYYHDTFGTFFPYLKMEVGYHPLRWLSVNMAANAAIGNTARFPAHSIQWDDKHDDQIPTSFERHLSVMMPAQEVSLTTYGVSIGAQVSF